MKQVCRTTTSEVFSWIARLERTGLLEAGNQQGGDEMRRGMGRRELCDCVAHAWLYFVSSVLSSRAVRDFIRPSLNGLVVDFLVV